MSDVPCMVFALGGARRCRANSVVPAVQNLMLAARALGIGSVPTTLHPTVMDRFRDMFGIPDDVAFHFCVPLGYPKGNFGPTTRRPTSETTFLNRWDARFRGSDRHTRLIHRITVGATKTYSRLSSSQGSPAKPPYRASSSRPATSSKPSHSFFVAHQSELSRAVVEHEIDTVVTDRVSGRVRHRHVVVLAIESRGDAMVEREGIPHEPPARTERRRDAARRCVGGRPTSGDAAARGTGSRSGRPARRARGHACRLRADRAQRAPRRRRRGRAGASRVKCRCRSPRGPSSVRLVSRHARSLRPAPQRYVGVPRELE